MAQKNPADVAAKWARNLGGSTDSIRRGVQAVTQNPAERAIARSDAYLAGVQRAIAEGRYARGLRRTTLQSWQDSMINKGLPRVASGANAAMPKMEAFLNAFLPYMSGLQAKLANMPRGDLQTNIARMVATVEYAAAFKYTR